MITQKIKNLLQRFKNPKFLMIAAIIGILMILISTLFPSTGENKEIETINNVLNTDTYREQLEKDIKQIVQDITGNENATVIITLESGVKHVYAQSAQTDYSNSSGNQNNQSSESKSQSYITVKDSNGGEQPIVITENMPQIRGVAIICDGGDDELLSEKIKNAVTAALNITSKRVHISGGKIYEKG